MSGATQVINNVLLHRKSFVTESSLHATEPHTAAPIILSHESLWIDSEFIPGTIAPLLTNNNVNVSNDLSFYDSHGQQSFDQTAHTVVQKRVRLLLTRGSFGEYTGVDEDLRRLIHENIASGFSPVVEYYSDSVQSTTTVLPSHLYKIQYMAGVVTIEKNILLPSTLLLTAYMYRGRVGLDKKIKDPNTDDIEEGVQNRFFTKELLLSHMNELVADTSTGPNFVLSVASSDALTEGVHNKFFTQENFDSAFKSKALTDLSQDETARFVTAETMSNLNLSLGGVAEVAFNLSSVPPGDTHAKLYVERSATGENVLFFEDTPVGSTNDDSTSNRSVSTTSPGNFGDQLGNFTGTFQGPTKGVHVGDVKGNVQGFVSDLGNHPIIEAKILGNGEGHWVGTVNGDIVGKFEGHAKVVTGSVDNASHLTVGTFDATASIHVKSSDNHLKISHTDGSGAVIECKQNSHLLMSCSSLQTTSIVCENVDCSQTLNVNELNTNNLRCAGVTNSFYGIFETGRIEDVSEIVAEVATISVAHVDTVFTGQLSSQTSFIDEGFFSTISCNSSIFEDLKSNKLSVSNFHVQNLSFDTSVFLENPNIVFNTLSVSALTTSEISIGNAILGNVTVAAGAQFQNLTSETVTAQEIVTTSLSCSELHIPSGNIMTLSVNNTHTNNSSFLTASVNQLFFDESSSIRTSTNILEATTTRTSDVYAQTLSTASLTSGNCFSDIIRSTTAESQALSVGTVVARHISLGNLLVEDTLSVSSIDTQNMNVTQIIQSHSLDSQVGTIKDLSVQVLFSNSAFTELNSSQNLSANYCTLRAIDSLSVSSSVASFFKSSSEHHLCSDISVNSSHFVFSNMIKLSVNNMFASGTTTSLLSVAYSHIDLGFVTHTLSCGESVVAKDIHTPTVHTQTLLADSCETQELSTHRLNSEIVKMSLLSVSNANITSARSSSMSCSALACDDVRGTRAKFDILSVSSIVGVNLSLGGSAGGGVSADFVNELILSVSNSFETALEALSLQDIQGLNTLSCAAAKIDTLISDDIHTSVIHSHSLFASEIAVSSLSVATLHGIVLTQELSVTGLVGHISTASVTTSDLSCGTIFIDKIVRSLPHISDTNNPAILTTSTVGDFALFSEDTKHLGDLVVEGSLYVTDTIFMGTEPSLNIENVKNLIASSISVGELAVGMLTGIGGGTLGGSITDVVSNLLSVSPHDSIHEGNMQIEGNLVVSGVVLTGAHNKLMSNHGLFEMEGTLSVSGDFIAGDINIVQTLLSLQAQVAQLMI
jgi:hypothetical protein